MKLNSETKLKQARSYAAPVMKVVKIEMSQLFCGSDTGSYTTDTDPEIDELP